MGTLSGFMIGYVLGARTGPQAFEKLGQVWEAIETSPEFSNLVTAVLGRGGGLGTKLADIADEKGDLRAAWEQIKQSPEFQAMVGGGMTLVTGMLARGREMAEQANGHGR